MLAVRCGNFCEAALLLDDGQASTSLRDDEYRRTAVEWAEHTMPASTSLPPLHRTSRWTQRCQDTDKTFTKLIQLYSLLLLNFSLVASALVLTRLDYGCSTLAGLPARHLNRLYSPSWIPPPASCTRQGGVSMCLLFFKSSTGCAFQSGLTSALPF